MVKIVMKMDEADKKSSLSIIGNWNSTGEIFRAIGLLEHTKKQLLDDITKREKSIDNSIVNTKN